MNKDAAIRFPWAKPKTLLDRLGGFLRSKEVTEPYNISEYMQHAGQTEHIPLTTRIREMLGAVKREFPKNIPLAAAGEFAVPAAIATVNPALGSAYLAAPGTGMIPVAAKMLTEGLSRRATGAIRDAILSPETKRRQFLNPELVKPAYIISDVMEELERRKHAINS